MECALGLSPKGADANPLSPRMENGFFTVTYSRLKSANDVSLVLEKSTDLVFWDSNPTLFELVDCVDQGMTQLLTMKIAAPAGATAATYLRLKVTKL